jgi:hypothetical protein
MIPNQGEEIMNNYGGKGNEEFLLGFGFCLPDNTEDVVTFQLGLGGPGDSDNEKIDSDSSSSSSSSSAAASPSSKPESAAVAATKAIAKMMSGDADDDEDEDDDGDARVLLRHQRALLRRFNLPLHHYVRGDGEALPPKLMAALRVCVMNAEEMQMALAQCVVHLKPVLFSAAVCVSLWSFFCSWGSAVYTLFLL